MDKNDHIWAASWRYTNLEIMYKIYIFLCNLHLYTWNIKSVVNTRMWKLRAWRTFYSLIFKSKRSKQRETLIWILTSRVSVDQGNLCQVIFELIICCSYNLRSCHLQGHKKSNCIVNNLNPTEDWESSEKSHRASNESKLGLKSHLLVLLHPVVGWRVKVDLNEVDLLFVWRG